MNQCLGKSYRLLLKGSIHYALTLFNEVKSSLLILLSVISFTFTSTGQCTGSLHYAADITTYIYEAHV